MPQETDLTSSIKAACFSFKGDEFTIDDVMRVLPRYLARGRVLPPRSYVSSKLSQWPNHPKNHVVVSRYLPDGQRVFRCLTDASSDRVSFMYEVLVHSASDPRFFSVGSVVDVGDIRSYLHSVTGDWFLENEIVYAMTKIISGNNGTKHLEFLTSRKDDMTKYRVMSQNRDRRSTRDGMAKA